jgi:hypothetical protein
MERFGTVLLGDLEAMERIFVLSVTKKHHECELEGSEGFSSGEREALGSAAMPSATPFQAGRNRLAESEPWPPEYNDRL